MRAILNAVDAGFDAQTAFLAELTAHPSTRGQEQSAQDFMAAEYGARGLVNFKGLAAGGRR